jgi:hypothetical protein
MDDRRKKRITFARLIAVVLGLATLPAWADEPPSANVAPPAPNVNSFNIHFFFENDGGAVVPWGSGNRFLKNTDRHLTSGVGISIGGRCALARTVGGWMPSLFGEEFTDFASGVVVAQVFTTPRDLSRVEPDPRDWPYNGWLYVGPFFQRARALEGGGATFEHMQLDLGIMGGSGSLAKKTQKWVHMNIMGDPPNGWESRVHDEFGFDIGYQRKWRWNLFNNDGKDSQERFAAQVIPQAGAQVGLIHRNANAGLMLRAGWNLPNDFGPGHLADLPAYTGLPNKGLGGYVYVKGQGFFVEHNALISGNNFRSSPGVGVNHWVAELQAGLVVQLGKHCEIAYSYRLRSPEARHQDEWDGLAMLSLAFRW